MTSVCYDVNSNALPMERRENPKKFKYTCNEKIDPIFFCAHSVRNGFGSVASNPRDLKND